MAKAKKAPDREALTFAYLDTERRDGILSRAGINNLKGIRL